MPLRRWGFGLALVSLVLSSCGRPSQSQADFVIISGQRILMDTVVSIDVYLKPSDSSAVVRTDIAKAFAAMSQVDSLMSSYRPDSEVARINSLAATAPVSVSAATDSVLSCAMRTAVASGGAFDVTLGPILKLWGFGTENLAIPRDIAIKTLLPVVDYKLMSLHNGTVGFLQQGMAIDLGGAAKGYAVDMAVQSLQSCGYGDVKVKAGGDMRMLASELTAGRRNIWIQHPRAADKFFGKFRLDSGAVSTSGDYERFFETNGVRYHHIIDPATGYPSPMSVSATVLAEESRTADTWSTALFVLGPERGIAVAESLGLEAVILSISGDSILWHATKGFEEKLEVVDDVVK